MMMTEMNFETLVQYGHLTRLIDRKDYIKNKFTYQINQFKLYMWLPVKKSLKIQYQSEYRSNFLQHNMCTDLIKKTN
jgi:hypothetical protein